MVAFLRSGVAAAAALGLCAGALGQSDTCSSPTPISGYSSFAFDLTTATTGAEGQNQLPCFAFAGTGVERDVWFCWTATENGPVRITTCGETSADTKIIVYDGCFCPATDGSTPELTCNDDENGCGFQSAVMIDALAGWQYLIQLGTSDNQAGTAAPGNLVIESLSGGASDVCSAPTIINGEGQFAFDTSFATTGTNGQDFSTCSSISGMIHNDQWFCWTPAQDGFYTISTCGSAVDTRLAVYEDFTCLCPFLGPVACNDDGCGTQSTVTIGATMFSVYLIQVGNAAEGVGGAGTLTIELAQGSGSDECSGAEQITGTGVFAFDNTLATTGFDGQDCTSGAINNDMWFAWTAPSTGIYRVETCGLASWDTELAVYEGPVCPGICIAGNDQACGNQSRVTFNATSGQVYFIQVGSFLTTTVGGQGAFSISEFIPAGNDECNTPVPISGAGTFDFDNSIATTGPSGQGFAECLNAGSSDLVFDVWFLWTAPNTASYRVETCGGATIDTRLAAYDGATCPPTTILTCNDDTCGLQSRISFPAIQGQQYLIQVGGFNDDDLGPGSFTITEFIPVSGDTCQTAIPVTGLEPVLGTTVGAEPEALGTCGTTDGTGGGVWYEFVGYGTQTTITTCNPGSDYDTKLRVYTGDCNALVCVGGNDDQAGTAVPECQIVAGVTANRGSTVTFFAEEGVTYYILVHGFSGAEGNFELTFDLGPTGACCTDGNCELAAQIVCETSGGVFRGVGTSCTDVTYGLEDGGAFENIAANPGATELNLTNNSGQTVPIGFTFDFYGVPQTMVGVSDNGYLSFGGALNVAANTAIPNAAGPNGMIAPFWDDLNPAPTGAGCTGAEAIHYQLLGSAPNRRLIVQWTSVPQHDFFGRCLDSNTFQAVLFESGDVEFRYGTITPEATSGDYTVGIENLDGTVGTMIDASTLTSNSSIRLAMLNPSTICGGGTPTCVCETDGSAGVNVFDLLGYLDLWFASASGADIDGTSGVNVFDLLFFLDCWFPASAGAPCP